MSVAVSAIEVLCVDDHPMVRKGIAAILATETDIKLVGEAGDGHSAIKAYRALHPDVTLMDLRMNDLDGIETSKMILEEDPAAKIVALTSYYRDHEIHRALDIGIRGYILKETVHGEVVRAIRAVHSGKKFVPSHPSHRLDDQFPPDVLTRREIQVLELAAKGLSNKEIGESLGTAAGTAKMHLQSVFSKLGASDRAHAVALAVRRGILHLDF